MRREGKGGREEETMKGGREMQTKKCENSMRKMVEKEDGRCDQGKVNFSDWGRNLFYL